MLNAKEKILKNINVSIISLCGFVDKYIFNVLNFYFPFDWGCRIHRLHVCGGVRSPPNECPGYETKQSDGEVPVMLELWGMPSIPGSLWAGVVAPDRALSMGQIGLNCVLMLDWIVWNRIVFLYWICTAQNWMVRNKTPLTFNCKQQQYLYETKLFELELFDSTELAEIDIYFTIKLCTHAKLNCLK